MIREKKFTGHIMIQVEKEKLDELDNFLRQKKLRVSRGVAFSLLVDSYIKKYTNEPIVFAG